LHHGGRPAGSVRGRVILAADGLSHPSLKHWPAFACEINSQSRVGVGLSIRDSSRSIEAGTIYMAVAPAGYVGLVRAAGGTLNLAAAVDPAHLCLPGGPAGAVDSLLNGAGLRELAPLPATGWRGTPALTRTSKRLATSGVFALGDAAGYVEPFTGEGMAWAIASAVSVVPYVEESVVRWNEERAREWEAAQRRQMRRGRATCRLLAYVLRQPRTLNTAISVLARLPTLAGVIAQHVSPPCKELQASYS
jgi:menaquinone-9 beta-reductase